ncbi:MAG: hypothetical protein ED859_00920 [Desulfuromonadales bacterium]|nr:MAG: hypothetical protein ED859_00920 [Desulfuromonadales bacterium]
MRGNILQAMSLILAGATPALASFGITEGFTGVFIWAFCGYCAIIIVSQVIAAINSLIVNARKDTVKEAPESQAR